MLIMVRIGMEKQRSKFKNFVISATQIVTINAGILQLDLQMQFKRDVRFGIFTAKR